MIHLFRQNTTINGPRIYRHAAKVMPYQLEIKEEKEKTQVLCINVPSMRGKRKDTRFILNHTIQNID